MSFVSKNTAWKIWNFVDEATPVFMKLSDQPTIEDVMKAMPTINRFTVLLYNKTFNSLTTNECRRELFCQEREIDKIPPTEAALQKHTCISAYIAGMTGVSQPFQRKNYHLQINGAGNFKTENIALIGRSYQKRLLELEINKGADVTQKKDARFVGNAYLLNFHALNYAYVNQIVNGMIKIL